MDHFWNLVPELLARDDLDDADLARAACQKASLQGFQIGKTKVLDPPEFPCLAVGHPTVYTFKSLHNKATLCLPIDDLG